MSYMVRFKVRLTRFDKQTGVIAQRVTVECIEDINNAIQAPGAPAFTVGHIAQSCPRLYIGNTHIPIIVREITLDNGMPTLDLGYVEIQKYEPHNAEAGGWVEVDHYMRSPGKGDINVE